MAYKVVPNGKGGLHVSDDETLAHADCESYVDDDGNVVTAEDEARSWFAARDKEKREAYEAANKPPEPSTPTMPVNPAGRFN